MHEFHGFCYVMLDFHYCNFIKGLQFCIEFPFRAKSYSVLCFESFEISKWKDDFAFAILTNF